MIEVIRIVLTLTLCAIVAFIAPRPSLHTFGNAFFERVESYGIAEFLSEWCAIVTMYCPNERENGFSVKFHV